MHPPLEMEYRGSGAVTENLHWGQFFFCVVGFCPIDFSLKVAGIVDRPQEKRLVFRPSYVCVALLPHRLGCSTSFDWARKEPCWGNPPLSTGPGLTIHRKCDG